MKNRGIGTMRLRFHFGLALLLGLTACGDWFAASSSEEAEFRPYASYDVADLESLAAAYRAEVQELEARYETVKRRAARAGGARDRAHLDQQVEEFERAQQRGNAVRGIGAELSEREAALREVERELTRKRAEAASWTAGLTRLFSSLR